MAEPETNRKNHRRKVAAAVVLSAIAVIAAISVVFYLRYKSTHITTDDAFITGRVHTVAFKVPGTVKAVHVSDNQLVNKGDLLLELDPVDYEVRVQKALSDLAEEEAKLSEQEAKVEAAESRHSELMADVEASKAELGLEEARLGQAEIDIRRYESLFKKDAVPRERYQRTETDYTVAQARVTASAKELARAEMALKAQEAVIKQARASRKSQLSAIKQKEALLEAARLDLGYTKVYAPSEGYVTRKSIEVGNQVQAEQPVMALVALDDVWVVANYKETQLDKVRPGQKVKIEVDTYPGKTFTGQVESIMAGTGAVFSLFPPENATGNFVKVVQRIPVKILLDPGQDEEHVLRIGMSAVPTVLVE